MAGVQPFFLTGANAKIRVNGVTLAYCTNLSYSIAVNHIAPHVLGMYEATNVEPVSYKVTGTFSIIKYTADANEIVQEPANVNARGNGIGSWSLKDGALGRFIQGLKFKSADARVYDSLNPRELSKATGFTIEVFQKLLDTSLPVAKIRECRITRADFNISKKSPATQRFQFTALYVDEDTFLADFSDSSIKHS